MPQERLSVRKLKEVLRLHSLGLKQRQIARSCSVAQSTVHEYLKAAAAAGVSWPVPPEWDDQQLEAAIFNTPLPAAGWNKNPLPDFAAIHQDLQKHRNLTLQLVWDEYRQANPEGYGYSRFCELYRNWLGKRDVVLRQTHRAGEKLFVDYAGDKIPIWNPETGEVALEASIFVAVLGASSYTYAEATESQDLPCWIGSHIRTFEFIGGLTEAIVPDNTRTGVSKACRYEPDLNPTYQEMAAHYGVAVVPARPYKPRDKAKVEVGVQVVQRWIVAALRHRKMFSLDELNSAIGELLVRLNQRPFRKREGSRASLFEQMDQPALRPLPAERYQFGKWKKTRVPLDYHVEADRHYYSVPYTLAGEDVELRVAAYTVEVFHRGVRVASHARSSVEHNNTTVAAHRPKSHQKYLEWTPTKIIACGQQIGPNTAQLLETILLTRRHPEQGFRSCLGILSLARLYSEERLEAAAARAVRCRAFNYPSIQSILKNNLDRVPKAEKGKQQQTASHENIRGAEYYDDPQTIQ